MRDELIKLERYQEIIKFAIEEIGTNEQKNIVLELLSDNVIKITMERKGLELDKHYPEGDIYDWQLVFTELFGRNELIKDKLPIEDILSGLPNTFVTTVVHKKNIGELHELYDFVKTLDLDLWRLVNIEPIGRAEEHSDLLLDKNDFIKLFEFIKEKRFSDKKMDVSFGCSHYLTPKYERMIRDTYFICGAGIYVASILCNGDIYACLDIERNEKLVQGSIYSDSFTDIWENQFKCFREDRTNLSSKCKNCPEKMFCKGDSAHTWDFEKSQPKLCIKDVTNEER